MTDQENEIQVSWQVDGIEVGAALTIPAGSGPFPAVLMVAGSGPTDRNWNTPLLPGTNGSAALLARLLTGAGFVTLRYDKRAAGPHGIENAKQLMGKISMQGHLEELAGGMLLLDERPDVDSRRIFALTNSEGAIHALNYQLEASKLPFAGLVLTAPPGRPISVVAHGQLAAQLAPVPGGDAMLAAYDQAIQNFAAGQPVNLDANLPEGIQNLINGITAPINQPFSKELWFIDASTMVEKMTRPVLIVIGKKDLQVGWQTDGGVFAEIAARKTNLTLVFPENANHVLKYEPKPVSELTVQYISENYNADTARLDDQVVETILAWLKARQ